MYNISPRLALHVPGAISRGRKKIVQGENFTLEQSGMRKGPPALHEGMKFLCQHW